MFGRTTTISQLVADIISLPPEDVGLLEMDQLEGFINKAKSALLLREFPRLADIFTVHVGDGPRDRQAVLDILCAFVREGGQVGSTPFGSLVVSMVNKNYLKSTAIAALADFLPPGDLPLVNADGVLEV